MRYSQYRHKNRHILISQDTLKNFPDTLFDQCPNTTGTLATCTQGRGTVVFFEHDNHKLVLKRYHRGGTLGRVIKDTYLYNGLSRTRMWREFHLLAHMHEQGLPVPKPVAARCIKISSLCYQGELILARIPKARTLADILCEAPLDEKLWAHIGTVIRRFHQHRIDHADLNACNILINDNDQIFLIDFDKSRVLSRSNMSRYAANLSRLRRSLLKWEKRVPGFHFDHRCWRTLQRAYHGARNPQLPRSPAVDILR